MSSKKVVVRLRNSKQFVHRHRIVSWFHAKDIPIFTLSKYIQLEMKDPTGLIPSKLEAHLIDFDLVNGFQFQIQCKDEEETDRVATFLHPILNVRPFAMCDRPTPYQGVQITIPF